MGLIMNVIAGALILLGGIFITMIMMLFVRIFIKDVKKEDE